VLKENSLNICNGRLENGKCTFNSLYRNRPVSSTVDYLITNYSNFSKFSSLCIHDITEISDHAQITFAFNYVAQNKVKNKN
jgi:hypothetical protein